MQKVVTMFGIISGNITSTSKDGKTINMKQAHDAEVRDVLVVHPYGLSSIPYDGIQVDILADGDGDYVVLGVYDKNKPKVKYGETCIYTKFGNKIYLKDNGDVIITNNNCSVTMTATDIILKSKTKTITVNEICNRLDNLEARV